MSNRQKLLSFLATPTARLAATYLSVIMLMSIVFSVIFYDVSTKPFNQPMPTPNQSIDSSFREYGGSFDIEVRRVVKERFDDAHDDLVARLIWINVGTLMVGAVISYVLARRSLRPIEETMEAQTQFISDASHELRTPLTVLQTTNEVALRKKKLSLSEAKELLSHNVEQTKKLKDLSNTLLDFLKEDTKEVVFSPVALQDIVSGSLDSIVTIAQEKDVVVEDKVNRLNVTSNSALLEQLVSILLNNAVKYSKQGGVITISSKESGKKVYLSVADEGVGIRAADLPHIFKRFYRADKSRTSGETSGYGLGLAIADKIAKRLNVKIDVTSEEAKGSVFTLVIPLSESK